ncbi:hypothetical protein [Pedobacter sp. MW01-1-1]|uniref:hypothetical protein n=1 Tax=Pedobacter sp. MW01-1-1 TaxID=3383027 RepID=UPI003FF15767
MKTKLILLSLLIVTTYCKALSVVNPNQTEEKVIASVADTIPNSCLILKNNAVLFEKTYFTTLSNKELKQKLKLFLPSVKAFQLTSDANQNDEQLSGRLTDFLINYRKYGGTHLFTPEIMNTPIQANVIIQIREGKYRVTISEIIFKNANTAPDSGEPTTADDLFTRAKRSKIRTNETSLNCAHYMSRDLAESFDINASSKINTDF